MVDDKTPGNIPIIFGDTHAQMWRYMRRRYPGFGRADLKLMQHYPPIVESELLLHYFRGVAGPFIDFIVLIDVGCGVELVPTDFDSPEDGNEAKRVVEKEFEKMDLDTTMQRYSAFGEILGKRANVRTYDESGGFYINPKMGIHGIDAIHPGTLDMQSVEQAIYDPTGEKEFIQKVNIPNLTRAEVHISQDRMDYDVRPYLLQGSPHGVSAMANCITDLRTAAAAPELRLELMHKQSNIYKHTHLDIQELLKTEAGRKLTEDWHEMEKKLQEQTDILREQERSHKGIISYSFMKPAEVVSMSGKATDFADTEQKTYDVIATKMGAPLSLVNTDAAKTINRASMETILESTVRKREAMGERKGYRVLIASYAQEIKAMADIQEGYFKIKFKPFLASDLLAVLNRMKMLRDIGAASKTEVRRSQDMSDKIDFGAEGESADWQEIPGDTLIANPNPHLEPENNVEKKQRLIELKKTLRGLGMMT